MSMGHRAASFSPFPAQMPHGPAFSTPGTTGRDPMTSYYGGDPKQFKEKVTSGTCLGLGLCQLPSCSLPWSRGMNDTQSWMVQHSSEVCLTRRISNFTSFRLPCYGGAHSIENYTLMKAIILFYATRFSHNTYPLTI